MNSQRYAAYAYQVLGLKVCATTPDLRWYFNKTTPTGENQCKPRQGGMLLISACKGQKDHKPKARKQVSDQSELRSESVS